MIKTLCFAISFAIMAVIPAPGMASQALQNARVAMVHDGDTVTIELDGKKVRSRLIGIDAPESGQKPWGDRAKSHLKKILKAAGYRVLVEMDVTKYDKYNRLLCYLWLDEKRMVNEIMVRDGYAVLFTIQPNSKHADLLKKAQAEARSDKRGIWGADGLTEKPIEYKKKHPRN